MMKQLIFTIRQSSNGNITVFQDGGLIFHSDNMPPLDNKALRHYLLNALKFIEESEDSKLYGV